MNFGLLKTFEEEEIILDLNEAFRDAFVQQDRLMGTLVKGVKGGLDFIQKHPIISTAAMMVALNSYEKYKNNQKYAARIFAKTTDEKKFFKGMVDDLVKSGKYKIVKDQNESGGRLWVLRRLHENDSRFVNEFAELKSRKCPLSPSEKKLLIEAGCAEKVTPFEVKIGVWRSVRNGKSVFVTESGPSFMIAETVEGAAKNYHKLFRSSFSSTSLFTGIVNNFEIIEPYWNRLEENSEYNLKKISEILDERAAFDEPQDVLCESKLYEGLIKTIDIDLSLEKLAKSFPLIFFHRENDDGFSLKFFSLSLEEFKRLRAMINSLGWYFAKTSITNQAGDTKKENFNEERAIFELSNPLTKAIKFICRAKFDLEIKDISRELYHVTLAKNLDKIRKYGLTPRSRSLLLSHPERIYLAVSINAATVLAKVFKSILELEKTQEWVILKVKLNKSTKIFKDPDSTVGSISLGYYTLNSISPSNIEVIKTFSY